MNNEQKMLIPSVTDQEIEDFFASLDTKGRWKLRELLRATPTDSISEDFEKWWKLVHRKTSKEPARKAYARAIDKLVDRMEVADAHAYLADRMRKFAASPQARGDVTKTLHAATWLNQARYDDDEKAWNDGVKDGRPIRVDTTANTERGARLKLMRELREKGN